MTSTFAHVPGTELARLYLQSQQHVLKFWNMTVKETVRTRQAIGLERRFYARIFCTARTILIRPGVRANDSLFHSEVVSFV